MSDLDLGKIKRNVARMSAQGAPEADIDGYIQGEGATIDQVKAYKLSDDDKHSVLGSFIQGMNTMNAAGRTALKGATGGLVTNVLPAEMAAPVIWLAKNLFTDDHPTYGQARDFAYKQANKDTEQFKEDHPVLSPALEIGGAIATGKTIGKLAGAGIDAISGAAKAAPVVGDLARAGGTAAKTATDAIKSVPGGNAALRIAKGVATGGAVAGAYGAGTDKTGDFVQGFKDTAPLGMAIGGGVGAIGAGVGAVANKLRKEPIQQAEKEVVAQFKNKAEKFFATQLAKRPDLADALAKAETLQQAANVFGIKMTTAEKLAYGGTDPLLAQQGIIGGNPNTGGRMAAFYKDRSGQIENAYEDQASKLHPGQSYDETANAVIDHATEGAKRITGELVDEASPLYKEAFQGNKSMQSPLINKILDTPAGKDAFKFAVSSMQNQLSRVAVPDKELTEAARDLVSVGKMKSVPKGGVAAGLKLQSLDLIKRGFDDAVNDALSKSAPGTTSQKARDLMGLRTAFVKELDRLDVTGRAGPNSLKAEGGAYARARQVYSGNADKLALRERAGVIGDIDPSNPKAVASTLMQGTQATAKKTAEALGPEGKKAAAASIIREGLETNRGAPESLVRKLAPNDRTAEQLASYLDPESAEALGRINEISNRVLMGNRLARAPSPTQERTAAEKLMEGASTAATVASGGKLAIIKTLGKVFGIGAKEENPQFYEDMYRLMTTDEGMELARRIAAEQTKALGNAKPAITGSAGKALPATAGQAGGALSGRKKGTP